MKSVAEGVAEKLTESVKKSAKADCEARKLTAKCKVMTAKWRAMQFALIW